MEQLEKLFESKDGDLPTISEKMERTQNGARLKLLSRGLINDEGEKMDIIRKDDQPISSEEWTEEEQTNKVDRRRKTKTEISVQGI